MIFQVRNHCHRGREAKARDQETEEGDSRLEDGDQETEDGARRHEEGFTSYTSAAADEEHCDEYGDDVAKNTAEEAKRGGIRDDGQNHPGTMFLNRSYVFSQKHFCP